MVETRPTINRALKINELLCFSLYSANHAMNRLYKPLLVKMGLTYPQYLAMSALWENDDQFVGALCEKLHLESNTLTPLLKRLELLGYVKRKRDLKDERKVKVSLTKSGRRLRHEAKEVSACILDATGMSEKKLLKLKKTIEVLRENLTDAADAPKQNEKLSA